MKKLLFLLLFCFSITIYAEEDFNKIDEPFYIENNNYTIKGTFDDDTNLIVEGLKVDKSYSCAIYVSFYSDEDDNSKVQYASYFFIISSINKYLMAGRTDLDRNIKTNYYRFDYKCSEFEENNTNIEHKDKSSYINSMIFIIITFIIFLIVFAVNHKKVNVEQSKLNKPFKPIKSNDFERVLNRYHFKIKDMTMNYNGLVACLRGTNNDMELTLYIIDNLDDMMSNNASQIGFKEFLRAFEEFKSNNDSINGLFVSYFEQKDKFIYCIYVDGSVLFAVSNKKNKKMLNNIINKILIK